uniref:Uncharacterized protein n=1 Tax=Helianthus annuus TaxID=4232 RepID=A0A251RRM7_HELAN
MLMLKRLVGTKSSNRCPGLQENNLHASITQAMVISHSNRDSRVWKKCHLNGEHRDLCGIRSFISLAQ